MDRDRKWLAHQRLHKALVEVPLWDGSDSDRFHGWHEGTLTALGAIYGHESSVAKRLANIPFRRSCTIAGESKVEAERRESEAYRQGCERAKAMLYELMQAMAQEPEDKAALPTLSPAAPKPIIPPAAASKIIFVVHGHDGGLKNAVARFIEKLGLEPRILHERPDRGRTVLEKFEAEASVGYAIVLATADDLAASRREIKDASDSLSTDDLNERARQNVVFELGYFVGKLGRERVLLIVDDTVEFPSDLSGVIYAPRSQWQLKLHEALADAGFEFTIEQARSALAIRE